MTIFNKFCIKTSLIFFSVAFAICPVYGQNIAQNSEFIICEDLFTHSGDYDFVNATEFSGLFWEEFESKIKYINVKRLSSDCNIKFEGKIHETKTGITFKVTITYQDKFGTSTVTNVPEYLIEKNTKKTIISVEEMARGLIKELNIEKIDLFFLKKKVNISKN
jgi:hypothetical protein